MKNERWGESPTRSRFDTAGIDPQVVVHLVPGTWPYGFGGQPRPGLPTWFEDGSSFRRDLARIVKWPIEFRVLPWSFRNSVQARADAGDLLYAAIREVHHERPDVKQVVIAHSHGGNAAIQALSVERFFKCPVQALVCMATPFVFLTPSPKESQYVFPDSVSAILLGAIALVATAWNISAISMILILLALFFTVVPAVRRLHGDYKPWNRSRFLPPILHFDVPAFIVRSTRDEATLSIVLAQGVHTLQRALVAFWRGTGRIPAGEPKTLQGLWTHTRSKLSVNLLRGLFGGATAITLLLSTPLRSITVSDPTRALVLLFTLVPALLATIYLSTYILLASAAGFRKPSMWGSHLIEVEASPPEASATVKFYTEIRELLSDAGDPFHRSDGSAYGPPIQGLRHAVYQIPDAIIDIASVVVDVALGRAPNWKVTGDAQRNMDEWSKLYKMGILSSDD